MLEAHLASPRPVRSLPRPWRPDLESATNEFSFRLMPSAIQGVGVFALHDIRTGTVLALFPANEPLRLLTAGQLPAFPPGARRLVGDLSVDLQRGGQTFLSCPAAFNRPALGWFMNHGATPNAACDRSLGKYGEYLALGDIKAGQEILIDYGQLDF